MQDLKLDLTEQRCILSLCRGVPRVWGQDASQIPAKMGSSESALPAFLTSSDGWALHQEHNAGGPGGWDGGPENRPILAHFGREMTNQHHRATTAPSRVVKVLAGREHYINKTQSRG